MTAALSSIQPCPVERAIRPVALGRKNRLFADSEGGGHRWAVVCSLIQTCKLKDVEPNAYLCDVLQRMIDGYPINRLDELLSPDGDLVHRTDRFADDGEGVVAHFPVRHQVVGTDQISRVDLAAVDELIHRDGSRRYQRVSMDELSDTRIRNATPPA
jgi:hypothetical protein